MMPIIRKARADDLQKIQALYKKVARLSGGIARREQEITLPYIRHFMKKSKESGFNLVVDHPQNPRQIIGEIHCYTLEPSAFSHVLGELTIAVDPDFHGQGIGKNLFSTLFSHIQQHRPDIFRVELYTNEKNIKALALYERMGFVREGRLAGKIRVHNGNIEADIPMAWFNPNYTHPTAFSTHGK